MSRRHDVLEAPPIEPPIIGLRPPAIADEDRRRPGRQPIIASDLLTLLRNPTNTPTPDPRSAILALVLAIGVVCLCLGLGAVLRGVP